MKVWKIKIIKNQFEKIVKNFKKNENEETKNQILKIEKNYRKNLWKIKNENRKKVKLHMMVQNLNHSIMYQALSRSWQHHQLNRIFLICLP